MKKQQQCKFSITIKFKLVLIASVVKIVSHNFFKKFQGDVEEDEMVPDREEDIKPRFHRSKIHKNQDQVTCLFFFFLKIKLFFSF